jgi:hypothetical protein
MTHDAAVYSIDFIGQLSFVSEVTFAQMKVITLMYNINVNSYYLMYVCIGSCG